MPALPAPARSPLVELGAVAGLTASPDTASAELTVGPALHQPYGIVHGGVYAALAELVAGEGAAAWLAGAGSGDVRVTAISTQFLRAVRDGAVHAVATPEHRGRGQQVWQVRMTTADGALAALSVVRLQNVAPGKA